MINLLFFLAATLSPSAQASQQCLQQASDSELVSEIGRRLNTSGGDSQEASVVVNSVTDSLDFKHYCLTKMRGNL